MSCFGTLTCISNFRTRVSCFWTCLISGHTCLVSGHVSKRDRRVSKRDTSHFWAHVWDMSHFGTRAGSVSFLDMSRFGTCLKNGHPALWPSVLPTGPIQRQSPANPSSQAKFHPSFPPFHPRSQSTPSFPPFQPAKSAIIHPTTPTLAKILPTRQFHPFLPTTFRRPLSSFLLGQPCPPKYPRLCSFHKCSGLYSSQNYSGQNTSQNTSQNYSGQIASQNSWPK